MIDEKINASFSTGLTLRIIQSNKPKTLNSFGSIADGAQYIMGKCKSVAFLLVKPKTGGQAFHKTNWNVIVRSDRC